MCKSNNNKIKITVIINYKQLNTCSAQMSMWNMDQLHITNLKMKTLKNQMRDKITERKEIKKIRKPALLLRFQHQRFQNPGTCSLLSCLKAVGVRSNFRFAVLNVFFFQSSNFLFAYSERLKIELIMKDCKDTTCCFHGKKASCCFMTNCCLFVLWFHFASDW